jgi:hypothetical protein
LHAFAKNTACSCLAILIQFISIDLHVAGTTFIENFMNVLKEFIFFELGMRKPEATFDKEYNTKFYSLMIKQKYRCSLHWDFKFEFTGKEDVVQPFDKKII